MYGQICGKTLVVGGQQDHRRMSLLRRFDRALGAAFDTLLVWHDRARSRRMLRQLDDHMLQDLGIDRSVAEHEGSTPFWR